MSAPKIPSELVYLGDAVEVDGGESASWMWKPTDKMIVASDSSGRRIFVFRQKKPVKNPVCKTGMRIQSYLFDRDLFSETTAKSWLKKHGKKIPSVDVKPGFFHYRQEPTSHFKFIRTGEISDGISVKYGCPTQKWIKNPSGEILYEKFNHRKSNGTKSFDVPQPKIRAGRVHHIVYRSSKDGGKTSYIHTFETEPIVWVDRKKNPNVLVLQGGKIRVTSRGITG